MAGLPFFGELQTGPGLPSSLLHSTMLAVIEANVEHQISVLQLVEAAQLKPSWPELASHAFDIGDGGILIIKGYRAANRLRAYETVIRARFAEIKARDKKNQPYSLAQCVDSNYYF